MALRTITEMESAPKWEQFQAQAQETFDWQQMRCRLVTPIYGGGTVSAKPDENMPVRAAAIRGQLRFWWRLLAKHKRTWDLQKKSLRQAEFALWGGMEEEGMAGKVFLRVCDCTFNGRKKWGKEALPLYTEYAPSLSDTLSYVLFPARPEKGNPPSICLFKEGLEWTLQWRFAPSVSDEQKRQVEETLRWWVNFGGIGARTRRGCGAFEVLLNQATENVKQIAKPLSEQEVKAAGCHLVQRKHTSSEAVKVWKDGVEKLRDFRQKPHVGRNPPSSSAAHGVPAGRSRWPEPDALRRLSGKHHVNHAPEHPAGNIFPRGMFGMPIIFHFVGAGEPGDSTLKPVGYERMSSPLIIRPLHNGDGQWQAGALLLPHKGWSALAVELANSREVKLWDNKQAEHIRPLRENDGGDPLSAFLDYFKK